MAQKLTFRPGEPKRPSGITYDNGFGGRPRRLPTGAEMLKYDALVKFAQYGPLAAKAARIIGGPVENPVFARLRTLPDALAAFRHFLLGSGTDRKVNYDDFLEDDPSGRLILLNCRMAARQGAEKIYREYDRKERQRAEQEARAKHAQAVKAGSKSRFVLPPRTNQVSAFSMTSNAIAVRENDADFPYPATENWQKTIGAHFLWVSARFHVSRTADESVPPGFYMAMTIHAEDRYNFNPGQKDMASETPDEQFGVFEENGLAKQYMNYGEYFWEEWWSGRTTNLMQVQHGAPGIWLWEN